MANVLTGIRILCGILILLFPAYSGWYYMFYLIGGFTDAIDGTVARKRRETSDFGAKFDTVADFVFTAAVVFKVICTVEIPAWLIIWVVLIALIKIGCHLAGYIRNQRLITVHSVLNKICGGVVFLISLFIGCNLANQVIALVVIGACILTTIAAIAEGMTILKDNHV